MAEEEDSLDPSTPRLDKQKEALTSPSATTHGLSGEGADFIREHGFGDEGSGAGQGLRTGSLKTGKLKGSGGLVTGGLRNPDGTPVRRKLPRKKNNTGGGGVAVAGDDAGVHIRQVAKEIAESLALLAKPLQQFQVYRGSETNTVKVYEGCVFTPKGTQADDDAVAVKLIQPTSGDLAVTGDGSIWFALDIGFQQLSLTDTGESNPTYLKVWRIDTTAAASPPYSFRASAPGPVYHPTDVWDDSTEVRLYWEIAEVQLVGTYSGVVRQLQTGPIVVPNFTDARIYM